MSAAGGSVGRECTRIACTSCTDSYVKMAELIALPLKKPSDVDVIKPLTNVIKSTYNSADNPKDYTEAIADFSKLRNNALWRAFEKYESSLEVIYRYESSLPNERTSRIDSHRF